MLDSNLAVEKSLAAIGSTGKAGLDSLASPGPAAAASAADSLSNKAIRSLGAGVFF